MNEWRVVKLGELGRVVTGRTPAGSRSAAFGDGIPFITPTDMLGHRRIERPQRRLSEMGERELQRLTVPHGVAVSCIGSQMGKAALILEPVVTNQQINSLVPESHLADDAYLFYALSAKRDEIWNLGSGGSTMPILPKSGFEALELTLPPLKTQRLIARVLGAFDDKIELNRQMNETLEAMARALFKSWFVDFDPVRAKAEGRQPWGMDAATAALFPNEFEDSELGPIPRGWRVELLSSVALLMREAIRPFDFPDEIFDHFSLPAFDEGRRAKPEAGMAIKSNKFVVRETDVLLAKLNPHIPRIWLPDVSSRRAISSTEFLVLRPLTESDRGRLYLRLSNPAFLSLLAGMVTGTTGSHQRVSPGAVLNMSVVAPPDSLCRVFDKLVDPLLTRAAAGVRESATLAELRDALLPKLLSGEVRVREAERELEAAV